MSLPGDPPTPPFEPPRVPGQTPSSSSASKAVPDRAAEAPSQDHATDESVPGGSEKAERARALAPDLARGVMLLFIAIANVSWYLWAHPGYAAIVHPSDGTAVDRAVAAIVIVAVDARIYPMFAFLFGYGMVQFHFSRLSRGVPEADVRRQLRHRHWWLIAFGLVHAALLFAGDILGLYGLVGLVIAWLLLFRRTSTIMYWLAGLAALAFLGGMVLLFINGGFAWLAQLEPATAQQAFGVAEVRDLMSGEQNYLLAALYRVGIWLFVLLGQVFSLFVPLCVLAGVWAARHGLLDRPQEHTVTLRRLAFGGIAAAWLGGLPAALTYLGIIPGGDAVLSIFVPLAQMTGVLGGVGYVAAFGLLATWLRHPDGLLPRAVRGIGKRSLSFYLLQSVVLAPLLSAWGLGLGARIGTALAVAIAVAVWLLSLPLALLLERGGAKGPAEVLLRRLTYGRSTRPEHTGAFAADASDPERR